MPSSLNIVIYYLFIIYFTVSPFDRAEIISALSIRITRIACCLVQFNGPMETTSHDDILLATRIKKIIILSTKYLVPDWPMANA